jgi:hypothetical protein
MYKYTDGGEDWSRQRHLQHGDPRLPRIRCHAVHQDVGRGAHQREGAAKIAQNDSGTSWRKGTTPTEAATEIMIAAR